MNRNIELVIGKVLGVASTALFIGGALFWGTSRDGAAVLLSAAVTLSLAYFISLQLARTEERYVKIRKPLRFSLALILVGGLVGSGIASTKFLLLQGSELFPLEVASVGVFLLGIVLMVSSFAKVAGTGV